jgi:hypothetical protein
MTKFANSSVTSALLLATALTATTAASISQSPPRTRSETSLTLAPELVEPDGDATSWRLTAKVAPEVETGVQPSGLVEFFDSHRLLGRALLMPTNEDMSAELSIGELDEALHELTAVYQGDPSFAASRSPLVVYPAAN